MDSKMIVFLLENKRYSWLVSLALFFAFFSSNFVYAGFDPDKLSQSTVRILIKGKQGVTGAATGFLWQNNRQVVTSLHVLSGHSESKIIVEFGKKKRLGQIKALLPEADLVLLEVNKPVEGWIPLKTFDQASPEYKEEVSALGFNRGSIGMSTRELRKGFVKPEILKVLLPPDALNKIIAANLLDVSLPIYYLDGSLLPGYSGAPIVNTEGQLIGIGNGGLENGASSVSWVIPASNLVQLTQANTPVELPPSLKAINTLFSQDRVDASQQISLLTPTRDTDAKSIFNLLSSFLIAPANADEVQEFEFGLSQPIEVDYQQFRFMKVKTRTYQSLLESSAIPSDMNKIFQLFDVIFRDYKIHYQNLEFDVYEDGRYGLNIVVPKGVALIVEDGYLVTQGDMFCRTCSYEIQYHARVLTPQEQLDIQEGPDKFLHLVANNHWDDLNQEGDYGKYGDFTQIESFGAQRYVLRAAYSDFNEPFKEVFELNYFVAATNREAWFQAQGILNRFDQDFFTRLERFQGTDCSNPQLSHDQMRVCGEIETMFKVMVSVHLTTFSNKFFL